MVLASIKRILSVATTIINDRRQIQASQHGEVVQTAEALGNQKAESASMRHQTSTINWPKVECSWIF